ncbi:hypothetical protein R1flu_000978 [Riccia fluitans]|uniref:OVATE domain-containing protein n=1 Tax=Riccia fluitans TaxID=41844 RepID=A0ABD1Y1Y2_9MARC
MYSYILLIVWPRLLILLGLALIHAILIVGSILQVAANKLLTIVLPVTVSISSSSEEMGNGKKFKLSSMFPGMLSRIKGMTGKKVKDKEVLSTIGNDWSYDIYDLSISKAFHGNPPSPVRTFLQTTRSRDLRYGSSPPCPSPINIRFPMESPIRRMKSRPVSPPRRSANSIDSGVYLFDSNLALDRGRRVVPTQVGRGPHRSRYNGWTNDMHSDSELDATDSESARADLRVRTMSMQLDGTTIEWEREKEREWSEPENSKASSWSPERKNVRNGSMRKAVVMNAGEPSPIHTVHCMPPNTPSDVGNYSSDPRDLDHRSACPDFSSRELSIDRNVTLQFPDRKVNVATDDAYTSFSSDDDFFKVKPRKAIHHNYGLKKVHDYGNGDVTTDESEVVFTEDDERSFGRDTTLVKTSFSGWRGKNDGWGRVQSRFAEEEKQQQKSRFTVGKILDESDDFVTENETHHLHHHVAMSRREASLIKPVLRAKEWARANLRALSKASELENSTVEFESLSIMPGLVQKEDSRHYSRESSTSVSPVGEVEKHTKGRIEYKLTNNHDSDSSVYDHEHFSKPFTEYDFYKNAHTEESDLDTNPNVGRRKSREVVEFPSFRSDKGVTNRRSDFLEVSESDGPTPRNQSFFMQHERSMRKQTPSVTSSKSGREISGRKSNRSASPKTVRDVPPLKGAARSGSTRRQQELHGGSERTTTPPSRHEVDTSKKVSRSQSPRRQEGNSSRKTSSVSPFPGGHQKGQDDKSSSKKGSNGRSESPALSRPDNTSEKMGTGTRPVVGQGAKSQDERAASDSVAVVKASYDPYQDFRDSMVEMILENEIETAGELEELLQCYLSLNSGEYHSVIIQVFSDIWRDIFDP